MKKKEYKASYGSSSISNPSYIFDWSVNSNSLNRQYDNIPAANNLNGQTLEVSITQYDTLTAISSTQTASTVVNFNDSRITTPINFSTWSPSLWYDANDPSTLFSDINATVPAITGGTVGCWLDKSGNGRHATMATIANQPTLVKDEDGRLVLRSLDVTTYLSSVAFSPSDIKTLLAVIKPNNETQVAGCSVLSQQVYGGIHTTNTINKSWSVGCTNSTYSYVDTNYPEYNFYEPSSGKWCYPFNGTTEYRMTTVASSTPSTDDWEFNINIKPLTSASRGTFFYSAGRFILALAANLKIWNYINGITSGNTTSTDSLIVNEWNLVTFKKIGSNTELYINGILQFTKTTPFNAAQTFVIGQRYDGTPTGQVDLTDTLLNSVSWVNYTTGETLSSLYDDFNTGSTLISLSLRSFSSIVNGKSNRCYRSTPILAVSVFDPYNSLFLCNNKNIISYDKLAFLPSTKFDRQMLLFGSSSTTGFVGDILEVIAFNRVLTRTEINTATKYLSEKWTTHNLKDIEITNITPVSAVRTSIFGFSAIPGVWDSNDFDIVRYYQWQVSGDGNSWSNLGTLTTSPTAYYSDYSSGAFVRVVEYPEFANPLLNPPN